MPSRFEEQYRGYHLGCDPQLDHDGRFLAYVIISHGLRPVRLDLATTLDYPSFPTEESAVNATRIAAQHWVDKHLAESGAKKSYRERVLEQTAREIGRRLRALEGMGPRAPDVQHIRTRAATTSIDVETCA